MYSGETESDRSGVFGSSEQETALELLCQRVTWWTVPGRLRSNIPAQARSGGFPIT